MVSVLVIVRKAQCGEVGVPSKKELRVATALVAFAFHNNRCPVDELLYSRDVSTGEGDGSVGRYGGDGVASRQFEPDVVLDAARRGEEWRYSLVRAIGARDLPFGKSPILQSWHPVRAGGRSDFEHLPHSMLFPMETWRNVTSGWWGSKMTFSGAWDPPQMSCAAHSWKVAAYIL